MKKVIIELFILTAFSCLFIFYQFNQVPKKLSLDEVEFTRLALSLQNTPYIPYSLIATGHATLYFYLLLASFALLGVNNFALRFPSAFFGIADILLFYGIIHRVFAAGDQSQKKTPSLIPLMLAGILVSSRWYFNFARFSFEATFLLFLELASILFFLFFWEKKRLIFLIVSAIFCGLAFHSYYPGRIFFLLPAIILLMYTKKNLRLTSVAVYLATFFMIILPLILSLFLKQDIRFQQQFFMSDHTISLPKKIAYFAINVIKLTMMFSLTGDLNGRHNYPGKPILNPVMSAFFIFGFIVALLNLKNFYNQFFLIYFFLSLLPATLTYPSENPNVLRTYTALVPMVYFIGTGLVFLLQSRIDTKRNYFIVLAIVMIMFVSSSIYERKTYFSYQQGVFRQAFEFPGDLKRILSLKLWEKTHFY